MTNESLQQTHKTSKQMRKTHLTQNKRKTKQRTMYKITDAKNQYKFTTQNDMGILNIFKQAYVSTYTHTLNTLNYK